MERSLNNRTAARRPAVDFAAIASARHLFGLALVKGQGDHRMRQPVAHIGTVQLSPPSLLRSSTPISLWKPPPTAFSGSRGTCRQ